MAFTNQVNSVCVEVISDDECHVVLIYTEPDGLHCVETQEEEFLFADVNLQVAIAWASEKVETMALDDRDEGGETDDAYALASAGFGMDEDYGYAEEF